MFEHLLPYQREGTHFLATHRLAVLADSMGLGKTVQAIAAADTLKLQRILVICPAVARINWVREFERFAVYDRPFQIVNDALAGNKREGFSCVMSYQRALDLHSMGFFDPAVNRFDVMILDESQYLKNPHAGRTQKILGKEGIHRCADRIWGLTGTPVTRDIGDLWPFLYTFGATKMKYVQFVRFYCIVDRHSDNWARPKIISVRGDRVDHLKRQVEKVCLRRTVEQVLPDLPPVTTQDVTVERGPVEFTEEERQKAEEELEALGLMGADADLSVGILELMAPSCSTLRRYLGMQKILPAIEIIKEELLSYDHKLVVFAHHKRVCNALVAALPDQSVGITGDTPIAERQKAIDAFQDATSNTRVFVASIAAAGTAITLTAAHHVIFIEQSWIPADNDQAIARCRRLGQKHTVHVRNLTVANSIDEAISRVLRRRQKQISQVIA